MDFVPILSTFSVKKQYKWEFFEGFSYDFTKYPFLEVVSLLPFGEQHWTLCELRQQAFLTLCFSTFFQPDAVTEVKTDIYVTSFGPVSDTDMVSMVSAKVKVKDYATSQSK